MPFDATHAVANGAPAPDATVIVTLNAWMNKEQPWPAVGGALVSKAKPREGGKPCYHFDADTVAGRTTTNATGYAVCGAQLEKSAFQHYTNAQIGEELCMQCGELEPKHALGFSSRSKAKHLPDWINLLSEPIRPTMETTVWHKALAAITSCRLLERTLSDNEETDGANALAWLVAAFDNLRRRAIIAAAASNAAGLVAAERVILTHELASAPFRGVANTTLLTIMSEQQLHTWLTQRHMVSVAERIEAGVLALHPSDIVTHATASIGYLETTQDIAAGTSLQSVVVEHWKGLVLQHGADLESLWDDVAEVLTDTQQRCRIELDVTRSVATQDFWGATRYEQAWPLLFAYIDPDAAVTDRPGAVGDPLVVDVPIAVAYACMLSDADAFRIVTASGHIDIACALTRDGGQLSGGLTALAAAQSVLQEN